MVLVLYMVFAGVAVGYYVAARRKFAAADAHRAAGNLAYDRALWADVHGTHAKYTVADEAPAVAGLTAVKCCGCGEMVGVIEDGAEVIELGHRHIREQFAMLHKAIETQVPG